MSSPVPPSGVHLSPGLLALLLTLLLGTQPISTDLYLPSLPSLPVVFGVTVATVQLTLSAMVLAFGIGQLLIGPLADRYGRRRVLLWGLGAYLLASLGAMAAGSVDLLILARMGQGVGIAACVVAARSIVRDLFEPRDGARMLARALMWMSVFPLTAPIIGGWLETTVGWRGAFAVHAAFAALTLAVVARHLPETLATAHVQALTFRRLARDGWEIARHPTFLSFTAVSGFSYAALFSFLSGSSFALIDVLGLSRTQYGVAFASVGIGYLIGTLLCRRLVARRGIVRAHRVAAGLTALGGLSMAGLNLAGVVHPLALLAPHFVFLMAHGIHQPCAQAGAIGPFPSRAGVAAALSGFLTMVLAFAAGNALGAAFDGTVRPMTLAIAGWSVLTVWAATVLIGRHGEPRAAQAPA